MKQKITYFLLILLVVLNVILIFLLVRNPMERQKPPQEFLASELGFSEEQKNNFITLETIHKEKMNVFDSKVKEQKDELFKSYYKENISIDSITSIIGSLESKKDSEIFSFFKNVRTICTEEQAKKFDKLIERALHRNQPEGKGNRNHPPRDGNRPPPPR